MAGKAEQPGLLEGQLRPSAHPLRALSRVSLTLRFAAVSLVILLSGMIVIGWWVSRKIEEGVMSRTAAVTASFVTSSVAPQLQSPGVDGRLSPEQAETLDRLLLEIGRDQHRTALD